MSQKAGQVERGARGTPGRQTDRGAGSGFREIGREGGAGKLPRPGVFATLHARRVVIRCGWVWFLRLDCREVPRGTEVGRG